MLIGRMLPVVAMLAAVSAASAQDVPEMASHDEAPTFKSKVNLVMVPVVARDAQGRAVGNLEQKNFQLSDKGKPQVISRFSIESRGGQGAGGKTLSGNILGEGARMPERYLIYLFDDLHLEFGDLANAQKAAARHLPADLQSSDRAAIYTTSGRNNLDFTDSRQKLQDAVLRIRPAPMYGSTPGGCPDLTYYEADRIQNKNDQQALQSAVQETVACANLQNVPNAQQTAQQTVQAAASRVVSVGEQDSRVSLSVINNAVRRLSAMPGQRQIVLVSPGFITPSIEDMTDKTDILDRAGRANVVISALDARGLYTTDGDATQRGFSDAHVTRMKQQYQRESALAQEDVLAELAEGTGGTFAHNNNDLNEGLKRVAAAPEYLYLLGFTPQNVKPDGSFHRLKISLLDQKALTVQARRGYYAPKRSGAAVDAAKSEISDAVFSREEMHDLPVDLHTQFFKPDAADAKLTVLARVDLKHIHFEKRDGRNGNELTIVSVIFDNNGNLVTGMQKTLTMRLKDNTLARLNNPITVKTSFDVKPGSYVVRLVVRDAQAQMMAAENGAVDIP